MLVDTERIVPVTQLQRQLTRRLREVAETGEALFVMRNNEMSAVLVSAEEYEILKSIEEIVEQVEIAEMLQKRLKEYDGSRNVPWKKLKTSHGL